MISKQCIKSQTFERIIRDANGRLGRATFCVYENDGRLKARLVKFEYINELGGKTLTLSGFVAAKSVPIELKILRSIISPYFYFNTIFYSGTKPRATTR